MKTLKISYGFFLIAFTREPSDCESSTYVNRDTDEMLWAHKNDAESELDGVSPDRKRGQRIKVENDSDGYIDLATEM
jgi:hypothetical protein